MKMATYEDLLTKLTRTERSIIEYLFQYRNSYVKWVDVVNYVTGFTYKEDAPDYLSALNTMRVALSRMREKIKKQRLPFNIKTRQGLGLMLEISIDKDEYCVFCDYYLLKMYQKCDLHGGDISKMGDMDECNKCKHLNRIFIDEKRLKD